MTKIHPVEFERNMLEVFHGKAIGENLMPRYYAIPASAILIAILRHHGSNEQGKHLGSTVSNAVYSWLALSGGTMSYRVINETVIHLIRDSIFKVSGGQSLESKNCKKHLPRFQDIFGAIEILPDEQRAFLKLSWVLASHPLISERYAMDPRIVAMAEFNVAYQLDGSDNGAALAQFSAILKMKTTLLADCRIS